MQSDTVDLRRAFASFMTGVTIVATRDGDSPPVGFTANSFTSVSLEPPLLLVCPAKTLSSFATFERCTHFSVSVLADHQRALANRFVTGEGDRFAERDWREDASGCPVFNEASATFSLRVQQRVDAGDHIILIGEVEHYECSGQAGLGYSADGYFSLGLERRATNVARGGNVVAGAIVSRGDTVLMMRNGDKWHPPQVAVKGAQSSLDATRACLDKIGIDAQFGPVYSVFDQPSDGATFTFYRGTTVDMPGDSKAEYVAVDDLPTLQYTSRALEDMMRRYAKEFRQGVFRLYVGDDTSGDIHTLEEGGS